MAVQGLTGTPGLNKMNSGGGPVGSIQSLDKNSPVGSTGGANSPGGLDFKKALEEVSAKGIAQASELQKSAKSAATSPVVSTRDITKANAASSSTHAGVVKGTTSGGLKFSNHAIERMHSRGISFGPDEMNGIEKAIAKAAQKGAKDTLVLSGDNALIVSVKNGTVVTVMDRAAMKENVFTNIDSTVVI